MNRIFNNKAASRQTVSINPLHRPGLQLRLETEAALRDMAFVLQLTQRVKERDFGRERRNRWSVEALPLAAFPLSRKRQILNAAGGRIPDVLVHLQLQADLQTRGEQPVGQILWR